MVVDNGYMFLLDPDMSSFPCVTWHCPKYRFSHDEWKRSLTLGLFKLMLPSLLGWISARHPLWPASLMWRRWRPPWRNRPASILQDLWWPGYIQECFSLLPKLSCQTPHFSTDTIGILTSQQDKDLVRNFLFELFVLLKPVEIWQTGFRSTKSSNRKKYPYS